ncbi:MULTISPECIES: M15 family metallopeptidase [Prochlorococcus]|uniref:D-alanyl-D-alanine carboxypeptidase n=1 Tax=Prochlorococcus marinus str. MIT 9116 TaxID=167544 RepID=A0A0A1ZPU4_PROMR|nr:M15 family metallopeptidase [Prochlorococcus marinus]KGF89711.1 D-alanyl-D-alanine carboxypeptidase [Prochlorococcus marinus str. MIT 9107]KGF90279.1 D-alanyl-D-alanine carboxypeptidase [Prochlorococcus marinus str. MIT 9116]KGF92759.1 D-alanyl-D-alanine carboxypeptidase [Prochlorococcus marinus str. MIT 9123]
MEQTNEINEAIDIPVAERRCVDDKNLKFKKKIIFLSPLLVFFFFLIGLLLKSNFKINNFMMNNSDPRILGHLPYEEVLKEDLVFIEPHIWVHKDMSRSLLSMRQDAKREGVNLVFLSGYRSIKLQEEIFYSLKSIRNQNASERARVSAPPGYSEHSTGFAIDIGDANYRETDFEVEFENTDAFRWLKMNAAKYHFKLSFRKNNRHINYEPWHWRYEGSIEALKVFETANREFINASN